MKIIIYFCLVVCTVLFFSCDLNKADSGSNSQTVNMTMFQYGVYPFSAFINSKDGYISQLNPNTTYNSSTLAIGFTGADIYRTLLQFDIYGHIPPNVNIIKAELTLFIAAYGGSYVIVNAHSLNVFWNETEATWNRPEAGESWTGGSYDLPVIGQGTFNPSGGNAYISINLSTAVVKNWLESRLPFGILLKSADETNGSYFACGSNDNIYFYRPMLTIYYTMP